MALPLFGIILYSFNTGILSGARSLGGAIINTTVTGPETGTTSPGQTSANRPPGPETGLAYSWIRFSRWFLLLYLYLTFSWWCYYYMNGFGARPMIHVYPLLAFPLAYLLVKTWKAGYCCRIGLMGVAGVAVVLSLAFQVQQAKGNLFAEQSNAGFAYSTLFKKGLCSSDLVRQDLGVAQPDPDKLLRQQVLALESFAAIHTEYSDANSDYTIPPGALQLQPAEEFLSLSLRTLWEPEPLAITQPTKEQWLRCSGRFLAPHAQLDLYTQHLLTLQVRKEGQDQPVAWYGCRINNKLGWSAQTDACQANLFSGKAGVWDEVSFFVPLPKALQAGMILEVSVWNRAGQALWVDELRLEHWAARE